MTYFKRRADDAGWLISNGQPIMVQVILGKCQVSAKCFFKVRMFIESAPVSDVRRASGEAADAAWPIGHHRPRAAQVGLRHRREDRP